jgi:hypothetical protein
LGGPTEDWFNVWTPANFSLGDIRDAEFGICVSVDKTSSPKTIELRQMYLTVHFDDKGLSSTTGSTGTSTGDATTGTSTGVSTTGGGVSVNATTGVSSLPTTGGSTTGVVTVTVAPITTTTTTTGAQGVSANSSRELIIRDTWLWLIILGLAIFGCCCLACIACFAWRLSGSDDGDKDASKETDTTLPGFGGGASVDSAFSNVVHSLSDDSDDSMMRVSDSFSVDVTSESLSLDLGTGFTDDSGSDDEW